MTVSTQYIVSDERIAITRRPAVEFRLGLKRAPVEHVLQPALRFEQRQMLLCRKRNPFGEFTV